jgi:hypothetical protein
MYVICIHFVILISKKRENGFDGVTSTFGVRYSIFGVLIVGISNIQHRTPNNEVSALTIYSYFKASDGFTQDALTEWKLTVNQAVTSAIATDAKNTPAPRLIR